MKHAILSPSAAHRWVQCTRAPRLEEQFENKESDAAREGTLAHSISECLLNGFQQSGLALLTLAELNFFKGEEFYNEAMLEYSEQFAAYVLSFYAEGDILTIEKQLDLSAWAPESFGTSDANILQVKEKHLHIFDLKYGKGVPVSAMDNSQLKLYALGVLDMLDFLSYEIEKVTLHIFQPRIQNNSSFNISIPDLLYWGRKTLKPKALLAFAGEGEFLPGKHCLFCNAAPECKALADYNLELLKYDFRDPDLLEDSDIIEILQRQKIFESWISSVGEHALAKALAGKKLAGYKLVEGKSNRYFKDEKLVVKALTKILKGTKLDQIYKPQTLQGITELTKILGTETFNNVIGPLLSKPPGAPALVPEEDPRPAYNRAATEFNDGWTGEDLTYDDL